MWPSPVPDPRYAYELRHGHNGARSAPPVTLARAIVQALCHRMAAAGCDRCIVFMHVHKGGGTTMLGALATDQHTACGGLYYCNWRNFDSSGCLLPHARHNQSSRSLQALWISRQPPPQWEVERQEHLRARLYFGGYVAALFGPRSPSSQRGCMRVAIFREPYSRLASAITYCQHGLTVDEVPAWRPVQHGGDELCGGMRNGSVEEWARHFGSWMFRQLALQPSILHMLSRGRGSVGDAGRASAQRVGEDPQLPSVWIRVKQEIAANDYDRVRTHAASAALHRVEKSLMSGSLLDVVGIFEQWDRTMALLDAALPLSGGRRWADAARQHTNRHGSSAWKRRSAARLADARRSAVVARLLEADLRVYAAVVARFRLLCARHLVREVQRRVLGSHLR